MTCDASYSQMKTAIAEDDVRIRLRPEPVDVPEDPLTERERMARLVDRYEHTVRMLTLECAEARGQVIALQGELDRARAAPALLQPKARTILFADYTFHPRVCQSVDCGRQFLPRSGSHLYCEECRQARGAKKRARCSQCGRRYFFRFGRASARCPRCERQETA